MLYALLLLNNFFPICKINFTNKISNAFLMNTAESVNGKVYSENEVEHFVCILMTLC